MYREVSKVVTSQWVTEGGGVKVRRTIGSPEFSVADPFLLLDEAKFINSPNAGFPAHPHRGFETVSYLLEGASSHEDSSGRSGQLHAGDLQVCDGAQWMTAGRGIVHYEMPVAVGDGPLHALQLWINLSSKDKMCAPAYQELRSANIPQKKKDGVWVKVIAGESLGIKSPVYTRTPSMYLHFKLDPGAVLEQAVPQGWTVFAYMLAGKAHFGQKDKPFAGEEHQVVLFGDGTTVWATNLGQVECEFLLLAGQPLREPVARRGPFVMNTEEELDQAMYDFRQGKNGFENASAFIAKFK